MKKRTTIEIFTEKISCMQKKHAKSCTIFLSLKLWKGFIIGKDIQGVPKKRKWIRSLITASDFKIQTFTSNHSKKEVLDFSFDALFRQFGEIHRVFLSKSCDKNVSLFLIIRKKMAYTFWSRWSQKLFGFHVHQIWTP